MNTISITLDPLEAIKTESGFIIMRHNSPVEVLSLNIEARIEGDPINGIIEALESFEGTAGITEINIKYKI